MRHSQLSLNDHSIIFKIGDEPTTKFKEIYP